MQRSAASEHHKQFRSSQKVPEVEDYPKSPFIQKGQKISN
jgi:hypothetical protein